MVWLDEVVHMISQLRRDSLAPFAPFPCPFSPFSASDLACQSPSLDCFQCLLISVFQFSKPAESKVFFVALMIAAEWDKLSALYSHCLHPLWCWSDPSHLNFLTNLKTETFFCWLSYQFVCESLVSMRTRYKRQWGLLDTPSFLLRKTLAHILILIRISHASSEVNCYICHSDIINVWK